MSRNIEPRITTYLIALETEMRRLNLWSTKTPSTQALQSAQPFCFDTLTFAEWLQFIFIARMQIILERQLPLPRNCAIAPMAEESLRGIASDVASLVSLLVDLDQCLAG